MKKFELKKVEYNELEGIGGEKDICEELEDRDDNYICDAVSELADSYVPIYYNDLWANAAEIRNYIEDAINEGLCDTRDTDLMRIFSAGYYQYFSQVIYENIEAIAYNVLVDYVNGMDFIEGLDIDELNDKMNELAEAFDHNDSWEDLRNELQEWLEEQDLEESEEE